MRLLGPVLSLYVIVASASGCEDDKPRCCKPDERPGCCMRYGGTKLNAACPTVCDGMPQPQDPAWRLVEDENGCRVWSSEGSTGPRCGQPPPDAGFATDAFVPFDANSG